MKNLLETILKNIVQDEKSLNITEIPDAEGITLEVEMADDDKGLVIGKEGRNIKAIRTILSILAKREGKLIRIKIKD